MRKSALFILVLSFLASCFLGACNQPQLVEIHFGQMEPMVQIGEVFIEGEVNVPGIYPLKEKDTIEALLEAAGGLQVEGDSIYCRVYFETTSFAEGEQKIDLNRAPEWLLEALPGVGTTTARNIVTYRTENGQFRHIKDLMNVPGIGEVTYNNLADKITVLDSAG
jgi:competence protein ComEA